MATTPLAVFPVLKETAPLNEAETDEVDDGAEVAVPEEPLSEVAVLDPVVTPDDPVVEPLATLAEPVDAVLAPEAAVVGAAAMSKVPL